MKMSLSDCEKCWQTLCGCGYQYRFWSDHGINDLIKTLQAVKKANKDKCSDAEFVERVEKYKKGRK